MSAFAIVLILFLVASAFSAGLVLGTVLSLRDYDQGWLDGARYILRGGDESTGVGEE